jgi:hypothetical protein
MSTVKAIQVGGIYFICVFAVGFALGIARTALLAAHPGIGRLSAVLVELPIMLTASWFICKCLLRRFSLPATINARLAMGGCAFVLLMLAELVAGAMLFGRSAAQHFALYREPSYLAGLIAQCFFALIPLGHMFLTRSAKGQKTP